MTTTTKKGLYHSELVKRGEAEIKILSEVKQSKYEGKPPYVFIELDGAERTYSIENARIEGKLILRSKGEVLRIKATGSRDEADIEILSGEAGESNAIHAQVRRVVSGDDKPPAQPDKDWPEARPTVRSTSTNGKTALHDFWDTYSYNFKRAGGMHEELLSAEAIEKMSEYEYWRLNQVAAISATIEHYKTNR